MTMTQEWTMKVSPQVYLTKWPNGPKAKYIRIEDKKKERKRLMRSPDHRDNFMMACYAHAYFDLIPVSTTDDYSGNIEDDYEFKPATS